MPSDQIRSALSPKFGDEWDRIFGEKEGQKLGGVETRRKAERFLGGVFETACEEFAQIKGESEFQDGLFSDNPIPSHVRYDLASDAVWNARGLTPPPDAESNAARVEVLYEHPNPKALAARLFAEGQHVQCETCYENAPTCVHTSPHREHGGPCERHGCKPLPPPL
jgi:hypothetical protein